MKIKAFFLCLYLTIPFVGFGQVSQCISNPSGQIATSSKTKWIDVKRKVHASDTSNGCINSDLVPLTPKYRATIINSGDQVEFFLVEPNNYGENDIIHWDIRREAQTNTLVGCPDVYESYAKIGMRKTPPITFTKNSTESCNLYEKYLVELFHGNVLIDCMELFVIGPSDPDYSNNFDFIANSEQDDASPPRHRAVSYPEFSSEFINRSCINDAVVKEEINGKSVFTTYNDFLDSRTGIPGTLKMTSPSSDDGSLTFCNTSLVNWSILDRSRNKRNDVNFYPKHTDGSEYYYQVSIKVPTDYDDTFFDTYQNIVFEFHQTTFPIKELRPHCEATMHLVFTKNQITNDKIFKVSYGLDGLSRCNAEVSYIKGEWIDVTFRFKWKNVFGIDNNSPWSTNGEEGLFECWVNNNKLQFSTSSSTKSYQLGNNSTTIYGPNLDNYNPAYITFNQYRLPFAVANSDVEVNFETSILFDDFKISKNRPQGLPALRVQQNDVTTII